MIKLNLGCGYNKLPEFINIDNRASLLPDVTCDLSESIPFKDSSVDEIIAKDFLEHIPIGKTVHVIEEMYRVLKRGGFLYAMTPSTDGRGAFQDPTHVSFWNKNSWLYYMDDAYRNLYDVKAKFVGNVYDVMTDRSENVIHTNCILRPVKGAKKS